MTGCPSDYALEESLVDPATDAARHAASCADCARRLARMEEQRLLFRNFVRPATLDSILEHAPGANLHRRWWWGGVGVLAASAMGLALVVVRPAAETEHVKGPRNGPVVAHGNPLLLQVFASHEGAVHQAASGDEIPARAALRFRVAVPSPCQLSIVSIDGAGTVSHLYPSGGSTKAVPAGNSELEGGAQLDGVPGPERLFAVCTPEPLPQEVLGETVRSAVQLPGLEARAPLRLPDAAFQATLLLHKTR